MECADQAGVTSCRDDSSYEQESKSKILEQRFMQEAEECRKEYEQKIRIYEQLLQDSNIQYQENLARLREEKDKAISEAEQIKQEAEECREEYKQKIREKEQSLHDINIQYQENLARLREEKDQANSEVEQIKQEAEDAKDEAVFRISQTRVRPLNDLFLRVQGLLLSDFSAELEKGHFIRSVGLLDLGYMLLLGLHESDCHAATKWIANFGNVHPEAESESGLPLFEPYKIFPVYVDPETGSCSYQVKQGHPFVVAFRKRYGKRKNPLTQRTQAAEMLEYMRVMFSEFHNSQPPADGYQRVITNCCQLVQCYKEGRCSGKFPQGILTPRLFRDDPNAFCHPVDPVVCSPEQHFDLWLQLTQRTG